MSKRKLLLADDSITIQKVVNLTFADEGIEVTTVGDGDSAMEKLREFSPDLILADVNMPGANGYQICESVKSDESLRHIPVILLVGSFEPFDEEEAKRVGADDFLTKPFQSIRQLVNKVTALLNADNTSSKNYLSEFEETLEMEKEVEVAPTKFDDTEFDDEMIQTNQVNSFSYDEVQKFETKDAVISDEDTAKTQPFSVADVKEFAFIGSETTDKAVIANTYSDNIETQEDESLTEEIPQDDYEYADTLSDYTATETDNYTANEEILSSETEETDIEEVDSVDTISEVSDTEELIVSDEDETENESDENEFASIEDENVVSNEDESKNDEIPFPSSATILDLDDDLLELPPIEGEEFEETEEVEQVNQNRYVINESIEQAIPAEEPVAEKSEPTFLSTDSTEFPPALIEAIAQRVIEKLSAETVREMVPQQVNSIIKKMVEEKLQE